MSENPYQAPSATLQSQPEARPSEGSIESAVSGEYDLPIGELVSEAWARVKGNKLPFFLAGLVSAVVYGGALAALSFSGLPDGQAAMAEGNFALGMMQSQLGGLLLMPITAPLTAGMMMFATRRAGGEEPGVGELFAYFGDLPRLVLLSLLSTVLIMVGFMLFVVPGIYLAVGYAFAVPLLVDRDLSPWEALETSRKAVTRRFFSVFAVALVFYVAMMLLSLTVIGLFWALPLFMLGLGLVYRRIFGFSSAASWA